MSVELSRKVNAREKSLQKIAQNKKKVLQTVESMIEETVDEATFIENCKILSKLDFEDLNVERSLISICGYPLCSNTLKFLCKQKYKISLKDNKVYDLTERKLFCSDVCFTASTFVKKQLREEPFWLADENVQLKNVDLYKKQYGVMGTEVKLRDAVSEEDCNSDAKESKETKPRNRRKAGGLYFPYVKEDQMQKLKESMSSLTIREKPL